MKKLMLIIFLFVTPLINAQWSTAVDSATWVDYGIYPYLTVDAIEHSVIVVYLLNNQIRAKKYDKYGYPLWNGDHVIISDTTHGSLMNDWSFKQWGAVISDGEGGVIVCWEDYRNATLDNNLWPDRSDVYIQRVDKDGNILYGRNGKRISGTAEGVHHPIGDMKTDYNGGFYVGYSRDSTTEHSALKHYKNDGELLWEHYFNGAFIDVCATNEDGEVFINTKPDNDFRRYKLNLSGNSLWPDTLIGRIPEHREYRAGGAFSDNSGGVIGVGAGALKIRRVDSTGQYAWDEVDLNQGQFAVIKYSSDGKGGIYVNWPGDGVSVQRISFDGNLVFDENHIKVCIGDDCHGSRGIVEDGESGAITMWSDTRHDTLHSFYAQHIDSNGAFLWDSLGILFHSTEFTPLFSGSAIPLYSDGRGGAILLWDECCNGNRIYIKQISYNGNLGEVITNIKEDDEFTVLGNYQLFQNYPNPFNPSTMVKYGLPEQSNIKIEIFNMLGQSVGVLVNTQKSAGYYETTWNAENLPSGIYLISIRAEGLSSKKNFTQVKKALLLK